MELRRISFCFAVVLLSVISHCSISEAGISRHRRETDEAVFDETFLGDAAATDDEAQNDDGGSEDDELPVNASILTKPENFAVMIGKTIRLECAVSQDGIVVVWFKDNEQYFIGKIKTPSATDRAYIEPNSTNLVIQDLHASDSGRYRCELMLDEHPPVFIEHTLVVQEAPKIISFTASSNTLKEGEDLLLTCTASGSPAPSILWARQGKDGANEKLTEKDGEFSNNTFFIKHIKKDMSGRYFCYAINTVKSTSNSQAFLDVKVLAKPRSHVHKKVINADYGVEAILMCHARDEKVPQIQWYKENRRVNPSEHFQINTEEWNSNLTITPQSDEDFGTFTCLVKNDCCEHSSQIELVQTPVVENFDIEGNKLNLIFHSHQLIDAIELRLRKHGDSEENEWKVVSVAPPAYVEHKHTYELTHEVERLEPGVYETEIRVKNTKGWSKPTEPKFLTIGQSRESAVTEREASLDLKLKTRAEPIQTASVFRSGDSTGAASSVTPSTAFLSAVLMYLLVRTL